MKKGLPRSDAPRVLVETKGGPTQCCTPGWISVASVSTSTCSTERVQPSTLARQVGVALAVADGRRWTITSDGTLRELAAA